MNGKGVRFHHHEVVGARMARARLRALRYLNELTDDVVRGWSSSYLRSQATTTWSDSAVRRYARDAGRCSTTSTS